MTGLVKGFLETSFLEWPGRLAAVIFLPGCNFRCPFCHNHELVLHPGRIPDLSLEGIFARLARLRGWIDSVVFTGGEATLHPELFSLMGRFRSAGLAVKLDTNGSRPDVLERLIGEGLVQAVDMDLKAPLREDGYARLAGVDVDIAALRASMNILRNSGIAHRFRTTYVPGLLDDHEIREMAAEATPPSEFVLQPFDPRRVLDDGLRDVPAPSPPEMERLRQIATSRGLH